MASEYIIIDKGTNQLAYFQDNQLIKVFPVATGRAPSLTPEGSFKIISKVVNPIYYKLKIPGGSPYNPLGYRWMGIGGAYGIHGTNNPRSIGTYASAGCIRMYNKDSYWLFQNVSINTPVKITSEGENYKNLLLVQQKHKQEQNQKREIATEVSLKSLQVILGITQPTMMMLNP
ncbi:MAG: L,D-transpeptidase [Firmicutes bacterium]|nr:L,D-transpeptidase [Bacillota bacterium]